MPWRLDSITRTDDIVAVVHRLVAEGGVAAVSYRAVAAGIRLSPSTLHAHYPDRRHLFNVVTKMLAQHRFRSFADSMDGPRREDGPRLDDGPGGEDGGSPAAVLGGLLPSTPEDLRDTVVWLALRDLGRTEARVRRTLSEARTQERFAIGYALEQSGVPRTVAHDVAEPIQLLLEGLECAVCAGDDAMSLPAARATLERVADALIASASAVPTADPPLAPPLDPPLDPPRPGQPH